jgi:cytosine deaminase
MDLIVRNVRMRNGAEPFYDVGVTGNTITRIEPRLSEQGSIEVDGEGGLVIPSFVDSHSHIDKSMMIYQSPPAISGTLAESIARSYEAKRESSVADVVNRGEEALHSAVANGTGAIRVHCDLDFSWGTTGVQGLMELKERFEGLIDIQVLVLPVENPMDDELKDLVRAGMDLGADAIGGSPHLEYTQEDTMRYVDFVFEIAKEYDVDVDLHVDQNADPVSYTRSAEYVVVKTLREDYQGRVTINHFGALSSYSPSHAARLIGLMKKAEVNFVTCPKEELIITGMGPSRIKELLAGGVNCAYAHNNNADMFSPYGRMDMLEAGLFAIHMGEFSRMDDAETIMDMGTINPAKIMRLDGYGLEEGRKANFNVVDAPSAYEAFRRNADRCYVIREGRVVAETRTKTTFHFDTPETAAT